MFLKVITAVLLLCLWLCVPPLIVMGRSLKTDREILGSVDGELLGRKLRLLKGMGILLVLILALILWQVFKSPDPYSAVSPGLHMFHRTMYILFGGLLLAIIFRFTGIRYPKVHGPAAYVLVGILFILTASGSWMLYWLPT